MGSNAGTRRFEYKDDKSSKFWEICVEGNGFTVRYGKIGAEGQTQNKEFVDAATTEKQAQKLITEKTGKGYQEVGVGGVATTSSTSSAGPGSKPVVSSTKVKGSANNITELVVAIKNGDSDVVANILESGFNPNTRFGFGNAYGNSPLHVAVETAYWSISNHAFLKVVPTLFEVTEKTRWNWGRLLGSGNSENKSLNIISVLLDKGADPLALNGEGLTPLEALLKDSSSISISRQDLSSRLFQQLVPSSGSAPSLQGELLRSVGKLRHERFQNGWANLIDSAYELELDNLYQFFFNPDRLSCFSAKEQKLCQLAISMTFLDTYEESGYKPTHSLIGAELLSNKKAIRSGWKRACSELDENSAVSDDPLEAVADCCIEFCRRHPVLIDAGNQQLMSSSIADLFEAATVETPATITPALQQALSSAANKAWLAVQASVSADSQVIDRILKMEDWNLQYALCQNPFLNARHIDILAKINRLKENLAANPVVPMNKLNGWSKDEDPAVRMGVSRNSVTPLATLARLSRDEYPGVQEAAKQEISRRESGCGEVDALNGQYFGDDWGSQTRLALISDDQDAFFRLLNASDSPEVLSQLLILVCTMPIPANRRLAYADPLLAKCGTATGKFIGLLLESFTTDLGSRNSDAEVTDMSELLLNLLGHECSLESVSAEIQVELYEFHRKGRKEASEVLFALIDRGMPVLEDATSWRRKKDGNSFLEKAIHHGDVELVSRVIRSPGNASDDVAENALIAAFKKKNQEMLDLLLSTGVERYVSATAISRTIFNICNPDSGNPAGLESMSKLITAYRKLESEEAVTSMLFERLCDAVENGYLGLVEELIRNGAPVDHREGKVTWGNLLGSFFEMNPKDKVFMALVDAGLELSHPAANKYRKDIEKILKRAKHCDPA